MADQSEQGTDQPTPVTACQRCRKQKLRCTRELPSCRRCRDISGVCIYPPPPDRKLLAAQRAQNAKVQALLESEESTPGHEREYLPVHLAEEPPSYLDRPGLGNRRTFGTSSTELIKRSISDTTTASSGPSFLQVQFPSKQVALLLIDIFFTSMETSCLLLHKQTLLSDLESNSAPDFIFLSVFALASIFLQPLPARIHDQAAKYGLTGSLPDCTRLSADWAAAASEQVLVHVDYPRLESIQACRTLSVYWFSRNQMNRANIHSNIAYRTCRLLGFHIQPAVETEIDILYGEIKRRCFWATWITNCVSQENANFRSDSRKEAPGLALPASEASFSMGNPILKESYDEEGHIEVSLEAVDPAGPSIMGELVKIYGIWWEIQRFAKKYVKNTKSDQRVFHDSTKRLSALQEFDHELEVLHDNFPPEFQYHGVASFISPKANPHHIFTIHSLYHLCAAALHSSVVPLFSNIASDPQMPKKMTRMCAKEAVDHSKLLIDLAAAFVTTSPDMSQLPSMVGYAMFVASTIHFKSLGAQGKLREHSLAILYPAVSILDHMKEYWMVLQGMWRELALLLWSVGANINNLSSAATNPTVPESSTDIEQIVKQGVIPDAADSGHLYTFLENDDNKPESSRRASSRRTMVGIPTAYSRSIDISSGDSVASSNLGYATTTDGIPGTVGSDASTWDNEVHMEGLTFWWDQNFEDILTDQHGFLGYYGT